MRRKSYFQSGLCTFALLASFAVPAAALPRSQAQDDRSRAFVTDNQGWEVKGRVSDADGAGRLAEAIKNFTQGCDQVALAVSSETADYVVLLESEAELGTVRRGNKITVFDRQGDTVFSDTAGTVGLAVGGACRAIDSHARKARAQEGLPASDAASAQPQPSSSLPDRSQYASLRDYDGHVWNSLGREEKLAYLAGHLSALEDLYAKLTVEFDLSKAVPPTSELVAASRHEQSVRSSILRQVELALMARLQEVTHLKSSVAEVSRHLDEFYEDSSLLKVPIVEAVDVAEMQTQGLPKEEIFRRKAELRSSASQ